MSAGKLLQVKVRMRRRSRSCSLYACWYLRVVNSGTFYANCWVILALNAVSQSCWRFLDDNFAGDLSDDGLQTDRRGRNAWREDERNLQPNGHERRRRSVQRRVHPRLSRRQKTLQTACMLQRWIQSRLRSNSRLRVTFWQTSVFVIIKEKCWTLSCLSYCFYAGKAFERTQWLRNADKYSAPAKQIHVIHNRIGHNISLSLKYPYFEPHGRKCSHVCKN